MIRHKSVKQPWYWIVAKYQGRHIVIGPKITEAEAQEFGYQKLDVPFEVVMLPTRDKGKAISMMKAKRLDSEGDLGNAIQKTMRKAPEDYNHKWWSNE